MEPGPRTEDYRSVRDVADAMIAALGCGRIVEGPSDESQEAKLLHLDCAKAKIVSTGNRDYNSTMQSR